MLNDLILIISPSQRLSPTISSNFSIFLQPEQ